MKKRQSLIFIILFIFSIDTYSQERNVSVSRSVIKDSCGSCKKKPWLCDIYQKNAIVYSVMPQISGFDINGLRRFNYGMAFGFGFFFKRGLMVGVRHAPFITLDNKFEHMFTFENCINARKYFRECRTNIFLNAGIGNTLFNYNPVPGYIFMKDIPNSGRVTHNQFYIFPGIGLSFKIKKKYSLDVCLNYNFIITNQGRGRVIPMHFQLFFNFYSSRYIK